LGNLQIYNLLLYKLIIFPQINVILTSVYRGLVLKHRNTFTRYNYKCYSKRCSVAMLKKKYIL